MVDEVGRFRVRVHTTGVGHDVRANTGERFRLPAELRPFVNRDAVSGDAYETHRARAEPRDQTFQLGDASRVFAR